MTKWIEIEYKLYDYTSKKFLRENKYLIPIKNGFFGKIILGIKNENICREIDNALESSELNKDLQMLIKKPYGIRDEKLVMIIPINEFYRRNINPKPGLIVSIDNYIGIIRSVNSGRVIVDFNHPLADKDILINYKINREVNDLNEKIKSLLKILYNIENLEINLENNKLNLIIKDKGIKEINVNLLKEYIDELSNINIEYKIINE